MAIVGIIGVACLALCYPIFRILERRDSRWSNMVLAILLFVGLICVGLWAGIN